MSINIVKFLLSNAFISRKFYSHQPHIPTTIQKKHGRIQIRLSKGEKADPGSLDPVDPDGS